MDKMNKDIQQSLYNIAGYPTAQERAQLQREVFAAVTEPKEKIVSNQERLDKLENMILSAGGTSKVFNLLMFNGKSAELTQIDNLLGDMLEQVLALKKELGCTSTLTIAE